MATDKRTRNERIAVAGCLLFASLSLGIGIYETRTLLDLLRRGARAEAVVVAIDVGVKGGKKAVFEFTTPNGEIVRARDLFQMYAVRHEAGDDVIALYAPTQPTVATIDLGPWTWQEPGLLYFGFVFMTGLGLLILRGRRRRDHSS